MVKFFKLLKFALNFLHLLILSQFQLVFSSLLLQLSTFLLQALHLALII